MKNLQIVAFLLTAAVWAPPVLGQTKDSRSAAAPAVEITAARCQYTPAEAACVALNEGSRQSNDTTTVAQLPRRMPGPPRYPRRPPMGPPGRPYSSYWAPEGDSGHAAIGALIGFGLGAAAGASADTDARGRVGAALVGGSLCALLGAVIGHGIPSFHHHYHRGWDGDPDEDASLRQHKPAATQEVTGD